MKKPLEKFDQFVFAGFGLSVIAGAAAATKGIAMKDRLEALLERLKEEQKRLVHAAAESGGLPSNSTLERVAQLEMNIAAVEHIIDEPQGE